MAYSKEKIEQLFDIILKRVREGEAVRTVLKDKSLPDKNTFYIWLKEDESKSEQYAHACNERADAIFEEILEIADSNDDITYLDNNGAKRIDWGKVQRNKTQIDARKWMLSKMNPKKYGDKLHQEHSGDVGITWNEEKSYD